MSRKEFNMKIYQLIEEVPIEYRDPITDDVEYVLFEDTDRKKVEYLKRCVVQRNDDPNYKYFIRVKNVGITPEVLTYAKNLPQNSLWLVDMVMESAFQLTFNREYGMLQKVNQFTLVNSVAFAIDNDGRYVYVRANNEEEALTKAKEFFKQK